MVPKRALYVTFLMLVCWSLLGWAADATQSEAEQMQAWWDDLEKPDPDASRALLKFAGKPAETVAFMKEHLQPLKIEADEVRKLLKDLGSDDDTIWKPAFEKLGYFDPRLAIELPTLMAEITDKPERTRMVEILGDREADSLAGKDIQYTTGNYGQNFVANQSSWWAEKDVDKLASEFSKKRKWTRAMRAIIVLEHINTPDAIAIIKDMSTGHPDAAPTKAANASLEVLNVPPTK